MSTAPDSERTPDAASGDAADDATSSRDVGDVSVPPCPAPAAGLVFDDPLDRRSLDDTDRGWGESASGGADDDFARFLSEKPPHHL